MNTRRQFLIQAPLSLLVATTALKSGSSQTPSQTPTTPGAPPTFGTGAGSGPAVTPETFAEAEKLMQVTMTPAERQQAAQSWRTSLAPYFRATSWSTQSFDQGYGRSGDALASITAGNPGSAITRPFRAVKGGGFGLAHL